jgi:cation:H+ antiporter
MIESLLRGGESLPVSAALFVAAAVVVWIAGARLANYADRFASATGLGGALTGLLLLGGITSLPEIATSATAAIGGAGALAANNLIGGVALQLLALAVVDVLVGREALTATVPRVDVLAYAAMNIALLMIIAIGAASGDLELFGSGVGVSSLAVAGAYALCLLSAARLGRGTPWRPAEDRLARDAEERAARAGRGRIGRLVLAMSGVGLIILVGGYLLTRSGEALAARTGLGESFFGAVFLAGATSLPELSSAIAAVRLGRAQMAIGDVLGGNLFNMALLLLVDILYRPGPVLAGLGPFAVAAACLGAIMCALLLIGLVERRDRSWLRMGYDTLSMVGVYGLGLAVMYGLRGTAG